MQKTSKDICAEFDDPEKMKSINDVFFLELKKLMGEVPSLIISLPILGKFFYRRAKCRNLNNHPEVFEETKELTDKILKLYDEYEEDKLNFKYEKFGKENHETFLLAKKQGKTVKYQKFDPQEYKKLYGSTVSDIPSSE